MSTTKILATLALSLSLLACTGDDDSEASPDGGSADASPLPDATVDATPARDYAERLIRAECEKSAACALLADTPQWEPHVSACTRGQLDARCPGSTCYEPADTLTISRVEECILAYEEIEREVREENSRSNCSAPVDDCASLFPRRAE